MFSTLSTPPTTTTANIFSISFSFGKENKKNFNFVFVELVKKANEERTTNEDKDR